MSTNTIYIDKPPYLHLATDAPVIAVKRGETGYYPIYTERTAAELNLAPVSEDVAESALSASMFGWDIPAAKAAIDFMGGN